MQMLRTRRPHTIRNPCETPGWEPSPAAIEAATAQIRAEWDEATRMSRLEGATLEHMLVAFAKLRGIADA